jgi:hypothetical protein
MVQAGVNLILTVFLLLLLVALSGATVRFLPQLPLPLCHGIGALASLPVTSFLAAFSILAFGTLPQLGAQSLEPLVLGDSSTM